MAKLALLTTVVGLRCYLRLLAAERSILNEAAEGQEAQAIVSEVGFVPTMGGLHPGHLSLIHRARQENRWVIVSIFVNPLQFGPGEDLQKYPRTLEQDRQLCEQAGVDAIFVPQPETLFPELPVTQVVPPPTLTQGLCGRSRPGHFQGVTTIVAKLLDLVQPERIYLGQKDAQQLAIVRRMVADLNFGVEVIACPTVREPSGLAYSSRNQYLTPLQQQQAAVLYHSLQKATAAFDSGMVDRAPLLQTVKAALAAEPELIPEYVDLVDPRTLTPLEQVEEVGLLAIAARLGETRLIDNTLLDARKPILTIDGPAGAGKSTVTRLCAQKLGLLYLDTGAMYRAVTWLVLQSGIAIADEVAIAELVGQCQIQLLPSHDPDAPPQVFVNGREVTQEIRSLEVTAQVSAISAQPAVRQVLVQQQQQYGKAGGIAVEGRDIGTHVFPEAGLKIFLTASVQERARRRQRELVNQGAGYVSLAQLTQDIWTRDQKDSQRILAPLKKPVDAIEVDTDGLTINQVTDRS